MQFGVRFAIQGSEKSYYIYELPGGVTSKMGSIQAYSDSYKDCTSVPRNEDMDDVLPFVYKNMTVMFTHFSIIWTGNNPNIYHLIGCIH